MRFLVIHALERNFMVQANFFFPALWCGLENFHCHRFPLKAAVIAGKSFSVELAKVSSVRRGQAGKKQNATRQLGDEIYEFGCHCSLLNCWTRLSHSIPLATRISFPESHPVNLNLEAGRAIFFDSLFYRPEEKLRPLTIDGEVRLLTSKVNKSLKEQKQAESGEGKRTRSFMMMHQKMFAIHLTDASRT